MRELYRLQRHRIKPAPQQEVWAIRYLGNRINNYAFMEKAFIELIEKYNEQRQEASIAALAYGGKWNIHDKDSIKTSFPSFLKIIKDIKK